MHRFAFVCLALLTSLSRPRVLALSVIQHALDNWTEGQTDDVPNAGAAIDALGQSKSSLSCTDECLKKLGPERSHQSLNDKNSCSRGCRFQVLAQLLVGNAIKKDDSESDTCQSMCREAYAKSEDESKSCQIGCSLYNPNQETKPAPVIAEFSWSWFIEEAKPVQMFEGDAQEPDDVLTDPSLRSQITKIETLRLPELRLKTIPNLTGDKVYSNKQVDDWRATSLCGNGGGAGSVIPLCYILTLLLVGALLGLWSCFAFDDTKSLHCPHHHLSSAEDGKKVLILNDSRCSSLDEEALEEAYEYLAGPPPLKLPPPPPYSVIQ